jgi:hypothetical protein
MQICRRLAVVRREVKKLAAIAEKRAVRQSGAPRRAFGR